MKSHLVICCLIGFGAVSVLASPSKVSLSKNLRTSVHEIASRYGVSNGDALKLVKLSDPKGQILDELEALLTQLRSDQNKADFDFESFVNMKASEKEALEGSLNQQKADLESDERDLARIEGEIAATKALITAKEKEASDADVQAKLYAALLQQIQDERAVRKATYDDVIKQHDDSLATLDQLIEMVSKFQFDDALVKLRSQSHGFLHRKAQSFAAVVQAAVELMQQKKGNKGPSKNEIRDTLIALLNKIRQGTEHSRALYVSTEEEEVNKFNSDSSEYSGMVASYTQARDEAQGVVDSESAKLGGLESDAEEKRRQIEEDKAAIQVTEASVSDADKAVSDARAAYEAQSENRAHDLSDVNKAIEYVNENVEGMTVKQLCNIGAPDCYRCLTHDQCENGESCSDEGQCVATRTPVLVGGTAPEHQTLSLVCPQGMLISNVEFASYGMPEGEFPKYTQGWCHADSSIIVVSNACVGNPSCSVEASNNIFGDPCYGTYKHMDITAVCK